MSAVPETKIFTTLLMRWHKQENFRQMPWKGEKDPYKIWLSEIILQQTRVEQGLEYFLRFVEKYPDIQSFAAAKEKDLMKMWEGLGYYSRCRNMIAAAQQVMLHFNGLFPNNLQDIRTLKGVGTYTAAAIASFAYGLPYAVVDGNVKRVLARFYGVKQPVDAPAGALRIEKLADKSLKQKAPGAYNQAIMDFGATVCKPKLPLCETCPLHKQCYAWQHNLVLTLPLKIKKLQRRDRWFYFLILHWQHKVYVMERRKKDIWQGLHEFYLIETAEARELDELIANEIPELLKTNFTVIEVSDRFRQQLTHQNIFASFIQLRLKAKFSWEEGEWIPLDQLQKIAFPGVINSFINSNLTKANTRKFNCKAKNGK